MMETDDILKRIFDKLDTHDDRLNTTCNTMTEIKTTMFNFIDAVNKREAETKQNIENRYKKITISFGSISTVSVLIVISKAFGIF